MTKQSSRAKGNYAEQIAVDFLLKQGFKILQRNYSFKENFHGGEIDIIARRGETIHFIEVKSRSTDMYGIGREAVGYTKQHNIQKLATHFLVTNKLYETVPVSLDIIEITNGKIEHLENCF